MNNVSIFEELFIFSKNLNKILIKFLDSVYNFNEHKYVLAKKGALLGTAF